MYIGLKIKELASKENLTLSDLAKRLGKTKQAVYEMVEKEDVNTAILKKLCSEFDVPINYFFEDNSGMSIVADNNSQAVVGVGNSVHNGEQAEISLLKEKVKHLEELLAEKERLIKVLMERK